VRIDLHTHSDRSDGTDDPRALMQRASEAGLDVVALTDHDTSDGWDDARSAAHDLDLGFVAGIEISCRHAGAGVHLLAYLVDPGYQPLRHELGRILAGRSSRLPATLGRLRKIGIELDTADVRAVSGPAAAVGRPHVADALVAKGVVATRDEAFDRYLAHGRPAYVDRYAAELEDMVDMVERAGGVTVIAHPWGRQSRSALSADVLAGLTARGLTGVEVDHQDHDVAAREQLREVADRLGLVATGASDFHGEGKLDCPLGCNLTAPDQLERLLVAAEQAATRSGRAPPRAVLP